MGTYAAVLSIYGEGMVSYDACVIVYDAFDMRQARRIPLAYVERMREKTGWSNVGVGDIVQIGFTRKLIGECLSPSYEKDHFKRVDKLDAMVESASVRTLDELVFPEDAFFARPIIPPPGVSSALKKLISEQMQC
ncbi:MAG: hypothetical protein ABIJ21_07550 [Nanoarchaeota archaeon]